jgi:hypothetical protein
VRPHLSLLREGHAGGGGRHVRRVGGRRVRHRAARAVPAE